MKRYASTTITSRFTTQQPIRLDGKSLDAFTITYKRRPRKPKTLKLLT